MTDAEKQAKFDTEIAPLAERICSLCGEHGIPVVIDFTLHENQTGHFVGSLFHNLDQFDGVPSTRLIALGILAGEISLSSINMDEKELEEKIREYEQKRRVEADSET